MADQSIRKIHPYLPCPICGTVFYQRKGKKRTCSRACGFALVSKEADKNVIVWRHNKDGYLVADIVRDGKRRSMMQHRLVVETATGQKIPEGKVVHHINGVRDDNRLENLEIRGASEHASEHNRNRKSGGWKQNLTDQQRKTISDRMKRNRVWEHSKAYKNKHNER